MKDVTNKCLLYAFLFVEKIGFEPMTLCAHQHNTAVSFHYSVNIFVINRCSKPTELLLNLLGHTDSNRNHLSQSQIY